MSSTVSLAHKNNSTSTACLPQSLKNTLATIEKKFGKVKVISTFRKHAVVKGTHHASLHASCRAVDFKAKNKKQIHQWLLKNHKGGIGYYTGRCQHLHIDNGVNVRWYSRNC